MKYDWVVQETLSGSSRVKHKYGVDTGSYQNSHDGGRADLNVSSLEAFEEFPYMDYSAKATVFGFLEDGTAVPLGTVTMGFTYEKGIITLAPYKISYLKPN